MNKPARFGATLLGAIMMAGGWIGTASAQSDLEKFLFVFDTNAVNGSTADYTFEADEIVFTSIGTSTVTLTDTDLNGVIGPGGGGVNFGDTFVETGIIAAVSFKKDGNVVPGFTSGITFGYELYATLDLVGVAGLVGSDLVAQFTGTSVDMFYEETMNGTPDLGGAEQIAALAINSGDCVITAGANFTEGSCKLNLAFSDAGTDGVWTVPPLPGGGELDQVPVGMVVDVNVDEINPAFTIPYPGGPGSSQITNLNHDGSAHFVPEPATLALIGAGLLGLGFRSRLSTKGTSIRS